MDGQNGQVFIEATCPENGDESSGNRIPELNPFVFQEIRSDRYEMRIQNAILSKYRSKYLEVVRKKAVPYIIAINICKLPFSKFTFGDLPWIIKALYPIGPEIASLDPSGTFKTFRRRQETNVRQSGYALSKCVFANKDHSLISGILCTDIPINLEEEKLGKDIRLIKNPFADFPLEGTLGFDEWVVEPTDEGYACYLRPSA